MKLWPSVISIKDVRRLFYCKLVVFLSRETEEWINSLGKEYDLMKVTEIIPTTDSISSADRSGESITGRYKARRPTTEELKRDFRYYMAVKFTKQMLDNYLITQEEYERICKAHIKNFKPTLAPLMM